MLSPAESIPTKSPAYLYAQSAFFTQFNDVDFYVEDSDQESLYYCILSRLFPKLTIEQISPLGGKAAVLEHAANNKTNRPSVYIVDKDFDDLLGTRTTIRSVFYLDRYCIENFVLETSAILRFIVSEKPTFTIDTANTTLDVALFLRKTIAELRSLFLDFFLVQKHALGLPNASMSVAQFARANPGWSIDPDKVAAYESKVIALLPVSTRLEDERKKLASEFELTRRKQFVGRNVSGKYLLALLLRRISRAFKVPGTDLSSARYRLAEYCTFSSLRGLRQEIESSLSLATPPKAPKGSSRGWKQRRGQSTPELPRLRKARR